LANLPLFFRGLKARKPGSPYQSGAYRPLLLDMLPPIAVFASGGVVIWVKPGIQHFKPVPHRVYGRVLVVLAPL